MSYSVGMLFVVSALGTTLLMFCCAGADRQRDNTQPPLSVTASQLVSDYKANEVKADTQYKGRVIHVTGKVDSIAKDILDSAYVTLSDGSDFSINSVQCTFDEPSAKDQLSRVQQLTKGEVITVSGVCKGKLLNVLLSDCSIR